MPRKILVIEDDPTLATLTSTYLKKFAYEPEICEDGETGLQRALSHEHDLIILDVGLPGMNGYEVCKRIRQEIDHIPIIMLTSKSHELEKVYGLDSGADDYLTKPFSFLELNARVKALLRWVDALEAKRDTALQRKELKHGNLILDLDNRTATLQAETLTLTPKEFELLAFLVKNKGRVFSREQLLDAVWGYSYSGYAHTVSSHINRLRGKLEEDPGQPRYILTARGIGYKMSEK